MANFINDISKIIIIIGFIGYFLNGGGLWCICILVPIGIILYLKSLDMEKEETRQRYIDMYGEEKGNREYENYQCLIDTSKGKKSKYTYVNKRYESPQDQMRRILLEEVEEHIRKKEEKKG